MINKKARCSRSAGTAKEGSSRTQRRGFSLNAHKVAIIVSLLSLVGILATSAISNLDKLRGNQPTQAQTPDTTGDLLAYNEQRRLMVEGAFDQALDHLQEAGKEATGPDAQTVRDFAASVREKKAAVQRRYDQVLGAIKEKKPVQAEINKTELNTVIVGVQREYDELRSRFKTQPADSRDSIEHSLGPDDVDRRFRFSQVSAPVRSTPRYVLPSMTFPLGREPNKFLTPEVNACIRKLARPAGA